MGVLGLALLAATLFAATPAWADSPSARGDLTFTEFQADSEAVPQFYGEWFEVYNNSGGTLDLFGVTFTSDSGSFTVDEPILVGVGGYVVFGVSDSFIDEFASDYNGGVDLDYTYSFFDDMNLSLEEDHLIASYGSVILDELDWTSSWGVSHDSAHQGSLNAFDLEWANDLQNNWCASPSLYGDATMKGTPGAENEYCSSDPGRDTDGDGYTETAGDCNDDDAAINPGVIDGVESPNGNPDDDANCDGVRDDGITDDDLDGYTEVDGDCNDASVLSYPGALETEDGADNDCNDCIDDVDHDGDGWGLNENVCGDDCDDGNASIYPTATEIAYDTIDQDCDGVDECDVDGDGYKATECVCTQCLDCDDGNAAVHPNAIEEEDGIDNDCDSQIDTPDRDGDGWTVEQGDCLDVAPDEQGGDVAAGVHPDADELCGDLLDNDCDGFFDNRPDCASPASSATVRGGGICGVTTVGGPYATFVAVMMGLMAAARRRNGDRA